MIGLLGTGGYAREVMPVLQAFLEEHRPKSLQGMQIEIYFLESKPITTLVNDVKVLNWQDFIASHADRKYFNVAIADSKIREQFAIEGTARGLIPLSIYSPSALSLTHNEIESGAILSPFSMITANAKIGKFFHANIYSYVAHDCVIGDYVTFAPNVHCNGNVIVEDHAYIGTGALLKQGTKDKPLRIGRGAVVGMGAVVTKDVAAGVTVVGNPAKELVRTG